MTTTKEYYCIKGNKLIHQRRIIPTDNRTLDQMQAFGYVKGKLNGIACHDDLSLPVFNDIPRMLDENTFIQWLEEYLEVLPDENRKYWINGILEKWDMDNPEVSDKEFNNLYSNTNSSEISMGSPNSRTYGSMYSNQINPYSDTNTFNYSKL